METVKVECPTELCNSALNGSTALVLQRHPRTHPGQDSQVVDVLLTSGRNAGQRWQFRDLDLRVI